MTFDHDLSNMSMDEAKLWIYLHIDSFRADILADYNSSRGIRSHHEVQDSFGDAIKNAATITGARPYPRMRDN